jgi:peptidylprolyl isomerase
MSAAALLLAAALASGAGAAPLRPERLVLRTDAGDLALALYAGAPRHARKLLALFASGAYDGVPLFKIDATRLVHIGGVSRRAVPLSAAALARIQRLEPELGAAPHRAGVVSIAHDAGDPDPAETSFVILLADMPTMDGRFTAVGEIAAGGAVLEALKLARVDGQGQPVRPLLVRGTAVLSSEAELAGAGLRGPDRAALGLDEDEAFRRRLLALAAFAAAAAAGLALSGARLGKLAAGGALLAALTGFFALFAAWAGQAARVPALGAALFLGCVGVFRLMNEFER